MGILDAIHQPFLNPNGFGQVQAAPVAPLQFQVPQPAPTKPQAPAPQGSGPDMASIMKLIAMLG